MSSAPVPSRSSPMPRQEALRGSRPDDVLQNLTQQLVSRHLADSVAALHAKDELSNSVDFAPPSWWCTANCAVGICSDLRYSQTQQCLKLAKECRRCPQQSPSPPPLPPAPSPPPSPSPPPPSPPKPPAPECDNSLLKLFPNACGALGGERQSQSPPPPPTPPSLPPPRMVGDENRVGKNPPNVSSADNTLPTQPPVQTTNETLFQGVGYDSPCRACCACISAGHG